MTARWSRRRDPNPNPSRTLSRRELLPALGLALVHLVLAAVAFVPAPHPGGDNGVYLALARSLQGGSYREIFDPAASLHQHFPPGWPLLMGAALATGGGMWMAPKILVVLLSGVGVGATYLWASRAGREDLALWVAAAVAVSPGVLALSHWELSDVPFWALTITALLFWERLPDGATGRVVAGSAVAAGAYLTRTAGIPLLVAIGGWLIWRRRWRQLAIYLAVGAPPVVGWLIWSRALQGYLDLMSRQQAYDPSGDAVAASGLLERAWENLGLYATQHLPVLLGGSATRGIVLLSVVVLVAAAWGWCVRLRRGAGVAEIWAALYLAMLLLWNPEWSGDRLLLPLYPLVLFYAAAGVLAIWTALISGSARPHRLDAPRPPAAGGTGRAAGPKRGRERPRGTPAAPAEVVASGSRSPARYHPSDGADRPLPPHEEAPEGAPAIPSAGRTAGWLAAAIVVAVMMSGLPPILRLGSACQALARSGDQLGCLEPAWRDFLTLARHARDSLPAGAVVLSRKPALFWVESGHPGRTYPLTREPSELLTAAREAGAEFLVLDHLDQVAERFLVPILIRRPAAFCVLESLPATQTTLLGIVAGADTLPDVRADPGEAEVTVGFARCDAERAAGPGRSEGTIH